MEIRHVRAALDEIEAERNRIQEEKGILAEKMAALEGQLINLRRAEGGLRDLLGEPLRLPEPPTASETGPGKPEIPPTKVAVYELLQRYEGKKLSARGIEKKLREAELLNPDLKQPYGTVLDAARRLASSDKTPEIVQINERGGRGVWFAYRSKNLPAQGGQGSETEAGDEA